MRKKEEKEEEKKKRRRKEKKIKSVHNATLLVPQGSRVKQIE